jgi:futalosine hydrolase
MNNDPGQILIVVAHPSEEEAVRRAADAAGCSCAVMATGVGGAAMSWALQKRIAEAGMTGSLSRGIPLREKPPSGLPGNVMSANLPVLVPGTVVTTRSECFADMGVDDNGRFTSLYGAGLADPDKPPFTGGHIISSGKWFDLAAGLLPPVAAATVNMASGSEAVIRRIRNAWDPDIETMEGAWLAYTCAMAGIPWIAVRAISNMVEPRNLKKWDIPLALGNLEMKMTRLMELIAPVAQNMKKSN